MKLKQVILPDDIAKKLEKESQKKSISQAEIVRRALTAYFENEK